MPMRCRFLLLLSLALSLAAAGCGGAPAPTMAPYGGDLIVHHQLDFFKLLFGTRIMFRDEAVLRFTRDSGTGELRCAHDPKTQAGSERLHAFMRLPGEPMPKVTCDRESRPPELPAAEQAWRVRVQSRWWHEFLGAVEADTEYVVGLAADGGVIFQPVREEMSQLNDTAYTWMNEARVAALAADGATVDIRPAEVGEFAAEARERVEFLQQEVPALGDAWRSALIDLGE